MVPREAEADGRGVIATAHRVGSDGDPTRRNQRVLEESTHGRASDTGFLQFCQRNLCLGKIMLFVLCRFEAINNVASGRKVAARNRGEYVVVRGELKRSYRKEL